MGSSARRNFFDALTETVQFFTCMFASPTAISRFPRLIGDWALMTAEAPPAALYMVILIFTVAGLLPENSGMVLMLVPLFFPVIVK